MIRRAIASAGASDLLKFAGACALCTGAAAIPYFITSWWRFPFATVAMMSVALAIRGAMAWTDLGLRISPRDVILSALLFGVLAIGSRVLITYIAGQSDVVYRPFRISPAPPFASAAPGFQALNEEMLRALLLGALLGAFARWRTTVIVGAAAVFSLLHFFYYLHRGVHIQAQALLSLFFVGCLCNRLFAASRHIGFPVAIHAAWNLTRFAGFFWMRGTPLGEGELFNIIEGSPLVLVVTLALCVASFMVPARVLRPAASTNDASRGVPNLRDRVP